MCEDVLRDNMNKVQGLDSRLFCNDGAIIQIKSAIFGKIDGEAACYDTKRTYCAARNGCEIYLIDMS